MVKHINNDKESSLEAHLRGGDISSHGMIHKILDIMNIYPQITIKSANLADEGSFGSESLAIDARTGETYTEFNIDNLNRDPNYEYKVQMLGMQWEETHAYIEDYS